MEAIQANRFVLGHPERPRPRHWALLGLGALLAALPLLMSTAKTADASEGGWESASLEVGQRFRDCPECPEMVVVPAGTFRMGAPESEKYSQDYERPVHSVSVPSFAAGVYELTFAEWDACAASGGCGGHWPGDGGWGRGGRPVINVNWNDAQSYVRWLSGRTGKRYRLLSESEWEYVARAGTRTPYHTGLTISTGQANYYTGPPRPPLDDPSLVEDWIDRKYEKGAPVPVGSFPANAWGLHDVHGNVSEWVEDCCMGRGERTDINWVECYEYAGAPKDGSARVGGGVLSDCPYHVERGGSWFDKPWFLRSANRDWGFTGIRDRSSGFRVARTLTP